MRFVYLLVALTCLVVPGSGHKYKMGNCPKPTGQKDFDIGRFLKTWYVIEQTDTDSRCVTLTYKRDKDSKLKVTKDRSHPVIKRLGVGESNKYTGTIEVPKDGEKAAMKVKWPLNPGKVNYYVLDTDYDNYALIFECQNVAFFYRYSAALLSTESTLPSTATARMKNELERLKIDTSSLNKIDQEFCEAVKERESTTTVGSVTTSPTTPSLRGNDETVTDASTNPTREPLDDNPEVPEGSPDDIPNEFPAPRADAPFETPEDYSADIPVDETNPESPDDTTNQDETPANPDETPANPNEAPVNPDETPANPDETSGNPDEAPANPDEAPANPDEAPANPEETPANPDETLANPDETPANPDETPANPDETPANPDETPEEGPVDTNNIDERINNADESTNTIEDPVPVDDVIRTVIVSV